MLAAAVLSLGLALSGCSSDSSAEAGSGEVSAGSGGAANSAAAGPGSDGGASGAGLQAAPNVVANGTGPLVMPGRVGDVNQVAQATGASVAVYRKPSDSTPLMTLKNPQASGSPLVFLVQDEQDAWVRVMLPVRPNQSQGWIKASEVKISQSDYRLQISIGDHTLTVVKGGSVVLTEKVGLGTATTPTPGGVYFIKELLKPPDPKGAYGPYAYGLSGYSNVLNEFAGGDGEIGIHGTNDPAGIGKSVSHGCIRLSNAAITKLAGMLPLGVPVQIVR